MNDRFRSLRTGIAVVAVLVSACSSGTEPEATGASNVVDTAVAGDTIVLRHGQSATLAPGVTITFTAVLGDSRCPSDVVCVWAGDAHVRLAADESGGHSEIDLHTTLDPQEADVAGLGIRLIDVRPVPVSDRPIEPDDYSIRLSISRG